MGHYAKECPSLKDKCSAKAYEAKEEKPKEQVAMQEKKEESKPAVAAQATTLPVNAWTAVALSAKGNPSNIIIDSGATAHLTPDRSKLPNI
ncbi:hypothetical protein ACEPAG_1895 [Sanghuangporus baumii]